jgi:glycosyltransferase involved in cell wall biosynthesis
VPLPTVTHLQRKPHPGQISNEVVFDAVRQGLARSGRFAVRVVVSSHDNSGALPRLRAVLEARRNQSDVTHVVGDVHFLTLLLRRRSTVLTIHDVEFLVRHGGAKAALYRWLWVSLPVRRSRLVTVVSEATRDDLVAMGVDPAVLRVVVNPVRDVFVPAPLHTRERHVVLLMGTWPNKNLDRSVAALTGLDVDVVVVGPLDDRQRALLAGLSARTLTDLGTEEVAALLHECDLLLFPSLQEGFGLPIVEAQASGRPVVTSDRRPMSDVAGEGACLVDPEDVAAIRAGVDRVLGDRAYAQQLVARGLRNVERFRLEAVTAAYEAVYDEVLS